VKIVSDVVIKVENVGLEYNLSKEKVDNIKEFVIKFLKRELKFKKFWAVRNVSFEVKKGKKLGIIGLNGAGKSTLLKLISGVIKPTEGTVKIKGTIVPLLELGSGFDGEYTGRENIYLKGALLGYSKSYLDEKFEEILEFSELGEFIDIPLKNYSSGMSARLAFSIATVVDPQIMILDEVLSVGDAKFRSKSLDRMRSMLNEDVTVLFVSHSIGQVKEICDDVIWLEHGQVVTQGPADEICDKYINWIKSKKTELPT
jgi:ABC-type polysaccharide/polyol phosphate transport system ATPase subunit